MRTTYEPAFQSERPDLGGPRGPRGKGRESRPDGHRFRHGGFGEAGERGSGDHGSGRGAARRSDGGSEHTAENRAERGSERGRGGRRGGRGIGPTFERGFGGRGQRARKGDVRAAILSLLAQGPSNGYGLIKAITEKSDGGWRPSPGSVYPTLAQLVDEDLIVATHTDGSRSEYQLTDTGRSYLGEHADAITTAWAGLADDRDERTALVGAATKLMGAIRQFGTDATAEQRQQAVTKLDELRRELYRILGE